MNIASKVCVIYFSLYSSLLFAERDCLLVFSEKESLSLNKTIYVTNKAANSTKCDKELASYPLTLKYLDTSVGRVIYYSNEQIDKYVKLAEQNTSLAKQHSNSHLSKQDKGMDRSQEKSYVMRWGLWKASLSTVITSFTRMCPFVMYEKSDIDFFKSYRYTFSGGNESAKDGDFCLHMAFMLGLNGIELKQGKESIVISPPDLSQKIDAYEPKIIDIFNVSLPIPGNCKKLTKKSIMCRGSNMWFSFSTPDRVRITARALKDTRAEGSVKTKKIGEKQHYLFLSQQQELMYNYTICGDEHCIEMSSSDLSLVHKTLKPLAKQFLSIR